MKRSLCLGLLAAALLAACGGGDGDSPTGLWTGTTTTNRGLTAVTLGDGSYYLLYGGVGNPAAVGGFVQGRASFDGNAFNSSDARDYNLEGQPVQPGTLAATLHSRQSFQGTVTPAAGSATSFSGTYDAMIEQRPTVAALVGSFAGQVNFSLGARPATFVVAANGTFSTSINGCPITGTVAPRNDVNAYDMTLTFGGLPCVFANETFTGIARLDTPNRLQALAQNAARTQGVVFIGTRQ